MVREAPIRSRAGDGSGDRRAGYVLIEMVAALAISVMVLGLAFPFAPFGTTPSRLLALVSSSVSLLREARTAAIAGGEPVAAHYDAARRSLHAGRNAVTMPADVGFDLTTGDHCPASQGRAAIVFQADGTNCGGALRFVRGGRVVRARVNGVDGHIDIVDGD